MSNLQFIALLSPAVGSFVLVILAWMQSNSRLSDLKEHMNQRFAESDRKVGELRFDVERKFVELRVDINRQFDHMGVRMDRIENDQKHSSTSQANWMDGSTRLPGVSQVSAKWRKRMNSPRRWPGSFVPASASRMTISVLRSGFALTQTPRPC